MNAQEEQMLWFLRIAERYDSTWAAPKMAEFLTDPAAFVAVFGVAFSCGDVNSFLSECDLCHDQFPLQKLFLDGTQFLCKKCRST